MESRNGGQEAKGAEIAGATSPCVPKQAVRGAESEGLDTGLERWFGRREPSRLVLLLMLATCFFLLKSRWIMPDSAGYYMFIVSPVMDGDFDYTNDLERFQVETVYRQNNFRPGVGGKPVNPFAIGSPLLLAPFFLAGHLIAAGLHALGSNTQPLWNLELDGLYYKTILVGGALLSAVGMLLLYRLLARLFSARAALWSMLLCWFATPLPAYIYLYGNHSHAASAVAGALVCWLWLRTAEETSPRHYFALGAAAGLAGLVRWQDALILGLALFPLRAPAHRWKCLVAAAAGFWLVFPLQLLEWLTTHGTIFVQPPAQGFMRWFEPEIGGILLSARMGLLTWHPAFLFSVLGLRHLWRQNKTVAAGVMAMAAAQIYVNACVPDWWGGNSFGQRRMLGILPLFALPMAAFFDATAGRSRRPRALPWVFLAALTAFNFLLFFQYYHQQIFFAEGRFDYREILANQLTVAARWGELVHPFLAENLFCQLATVSTAGRVLTLLAWAGILAGGLALFRRLWPPGGTEEGRTSAARA